MIRLRNRPPAPSVLRSKRIARTKRRLAGKAGAGKELRSEDFDPHWLNENVRGTLWEHQHKKCCCCERKRELKRESDVEHFRPKARVAEDPKHPGYWWLAYKWGNYLYACKPCNQAHKKNHFPLLRGGKRARRSGDSLSRELPVLINPIDEDPGHCVSYDWQESDGRLVKAVALDARGRGTGTIELMQLNRVEIMEQRAALIPGLAALAILMIVAESRGNQNVMNKNAVKIREQTSAVNEFAGFRRVYFRAWGLSSYVSTDA